MVEPLEHKALESRGQSSEAGGGASPTAGELGRAPLWRAADLGKPLPGSEHACSVALPRWEDVIGYEEEDPAVLTRLRCGYPRFLWNRRVADLMARCEQDFAGPGRRCVIFPSETSAHRCVRYVRDQEGGEPDVRDIGRAGIQAVVVSEAQFPWAKEYWRYSGEIVSSRHALAALRDGDAAEGTYRGVKAELKQRLAAQAGQRPEDVFLFPSGMAAIFHVHRMVCAGLPGRHSAQLEFPYVDALKVQRAFGGGVHFYPRVEAEELAQLERVLRRGRLNAVFCEAPSNPLMRTADLIRAGAAAAAYDVPLVVDDTLATSANIDAFRCADVVTTSLTKFFSGSGDVMGGSVILRSNSPFRDGFRAFLQGEVDDDLWVDDADVLARNSRDYLPRVQAINQRGQAVYEFLRGHPRVEDVAYPAGVTPASFLQLARPGAGFGGLMSILLRNASAAAPRFYNALRISKGPSLGTNFSLACPYTLLAHYRELDWAESCGVSRHLIRLSVGLEEPDDLIARLDEALSAS